MKLLELASTWVKGEVFQGKLMLAIGAVLLMAVIAILNSMHEFLRGTLVPLSLVVLVLMSYGGFQVAKRPGHLTKVAALQAQAPAKALQQEYAKAIKDDKAYTTLPPLWAGMMGASVLLFYMVSKVYWKGLSIGMMGLFLTLLLLDSTLHYRLRHYLQGLTELVRAPKG
ncbi:hypothetical protein [Hymenobacter sp. DG01]|uniref:hypothetical protein n=1 Tax=Hymenobacter sp. DG01 TaxID=2584940 RepID=UPI00111ED0F1|nr:hypothetical protein [Hymenobacter sp. DG01]